MIRHVPAQLKVELRTQVTWVQQQGVYDGKEFAARIDHLLCKARSADIGRLSSFWGERWWTCWVNCLPIKNMGPLIFCKMQLEGTCFIKDKLIELWTCKFSISKYMDVGMNKQPSQRGLVGDWNTQFELTSTRLSMSRIHFMLEFFNRLSDDFR